MMKRAWEMRFRKPLLTCVGIAAPLTCASAAFAQYGPEPLWIHQFGTNRSDYADAVLADAAGSVVMGRTEGGLAAPSAGVQDPSSLPLCSARGSVLPGPGVQEAWILRKVAA
jgi:hypothetical protein